MSERAFVGYNLMCKRKMQNGTNQKQTSADALRIISPGKMNHLKGLGRTQQTNEKIGAVLK